MDYDIYKNDPILFSFLDQEIDLLEIGILEGGSLLLWRDYFPKGKIWGIDANAPAHLNDEERIQVFSGLQQDENFLAEVAKNVPDGFDIIIDDASHIGGLTKATFWYLFENHLKPGGIYAIEDWGTGYWSDWADGEAYNPRRDIELIYHNFLKRIGIGKGEYFHSHPFGMVGFIKQLIDEQGFADLSARNQKIIKRQRLSKFETITVTSSIVFVKKRMPG